MESIETKLQIYESILNGLDLDQRKLLAQLTLLHEFTLVIKIINAADTLQTHNTTTKLFAQVLNPIKNKIKTELMRLGIESYFCEHGEEYGIEQICSCKEKRLTN